MLEYIKEDRSLSFSNWRYKILHWFLGVNPKNVQEATERDEVPRMFYTHYCPLFHLSNLIAIFLPLVVLIKIVFGIIGKLHSFYQDYKLLKNNKIPDPPTLVESERKLFLQLMKKHPDSTFEYIWFRLVDEITIGSPTLSQTEAQAFYEKHIELIRQTLQIKREKAAKRRNNIVFWVNFSRVFIKGLLNIFYLGLALGMLWCLWSNKDNIISVLFAVWNFDVLASFLWVTLMILKLSLVFTVIYFIVRFSSEKLGPIFKPVFDIYRGIVNYIGSKVCDVGDFISVFYEENCPAINIISEEEEEALT